MNTKSKTMKELEKISGGSLTVAKILKSIRHCDEMTQVEFAKKLGISKQNLCNIEKGRTFISPSLAFTFAKKLKDSTKQFVRIALQDQLNRSGIKYEVTLNAA